MNPRQLLLSLTLAIALFGQSQAADQPNIIFMMADDLGWGDVGFHGSRIATPNLDKLAERSTQLDQFYVQPVCSPTRGALMTGRYPIRLGLQCGVVRPWAEHGLPLDERTLAQALKEAGYETGIVGKWHLGHLSKDYLPTSRGFDHQYGHYNGALDYFTHDRDGGHDWHRDDKPNYDEGYATDLLGQEAVRLIEERDPEKPLFLYVPFNAVHTPIQAPQDLIDTVEGFKNTDRREYAAMTMSMDAAIGKIVAAADQHLPRENTLIIFTSDNGGVLKYGSNGDLRSSKTKLYEGGVRVPTLIAWEGKVKAGGMVEEPMHIVDMYPTLINLGSGSLEQEKPLDGKDVWATITQGAATPHETILLNVTPFSGALRMGDWKIVHNGHIQANATEGDGQEVWELFNLKEDPYEKKDLASANPEKSDELRKRLQEFEEAAVQPNIPPNKAPEGFEVPEIWGYFE